MPSLPSSTPRRGTPPTPLREARLGRPLPGTRQCDTPRLPRRAAEWERERGVHRRGSFPGRSGRRELGTRSLPPGRSARGGSSQRRVSPPGGICREGDHVRRVRLDSYRLAWMDVARDADTATSYGSLNADLRRYLQAIRDGATVVIEDESGREGVLTLGDFRNLPRARY